MSDVKTLIARVRELDADTDEGRTHVAMPRRQILVMTDALELALEALDELQNEDAPFCYADGRAKCRRVRAKIDALPWGKL